MKKALLQYFEDGESKVETIYLDDSDKSVLKPAKLPEGLESGSLSLSMESVNGKEAPAHSYSLRNFNYTAIKNISEFYKFKGDIDISVKSTKDGSRSWLTYTAYKNERKKK